MMTCKNSGVDPAAVFLCHPTGGGKYLSCDGFASAQDGINCSISPLLSVWPTKRPQSTINKNAIKLPNQQNHSHDEYGRLMYENLMDIMTVFLSPDACLEPS